MLLFLAFLLPGLDELSNEERAQEILTAAAVAQRGETALPRPSSLHGLFSVTGRKPDGSGSFSVEVERFYERSPERMLTRRTETLAHSDSSVGFDGQVFWMRDNRDGQVTLYSDDPETFHTDLALEREQLELTRLILDVISVDGLMEQLSEARFVARETLNIPSRRSLGDDREVDVVRGKLPDVIFGPDRAAPPPRPGDPPPLVDIEMSIDAETHFVHRVELSTIGREQRQVWQMVLSRHALNADDLIVPLTIRLLDERDDLVATLGLISDDQGLPVFELGKPLDPQMFEVPATAANDEG